MIDLKGKKGVVTGSARGIGQVIAEKLAAAGANVVISDILEDGEATAKTIAEKYGVETLFVKSNVVDMDSCKELVEKTVDKFGSIDILVNNAGVRGIGKKASSFSLIAKEAEYDRIMNVNVKGAWNMTKVFSKKMRNQTFKPITGKIINIASCAGTDCGANPFIGIYSASKAALIMFTKLWALELGANNITVNAICPGIFFTPIYESREFIKEWMKLRNVSLPIDRIGETTDVADVALFLTSPAADYITGQNIIIDGGMTISINKL